jgi:hypothetical protein
MVMPGAVTGGISITTAGGSTSDSSSFTVTTTGYPHYQQGGKIVGTGAIGNAEQGYSIAISADGNTVVAGGPHDNNDSGAVWIYVRSGNSWVQQGPKLVGTGATGPASQGTSVAISADGNTVIEGGPSDNAYVTSVGAVWIFIRQGSTWFQQGPKLVGTGGTCGSPPTSAGQGCAVALSADGNTAIVGGRNDSSYVGAVWIFTRSGASWAQQGSKLVGTGVGAGYTYEGSSVALSADGNTAIVAGPGTDIGIGAVWIFVRMDSVWTQQGGKLEGTGGVYSGGSSINQGTSVALSADGNTAMVGGSGDNGGAGAVWVYTRTDTTWTQQGSKLVGSTNQINISNQGLSVALSADGNTAIVSGMGDNSYTVKGSAVIYTRAGGIWTQTSGVWDTGAVGPSLYYNVALSADGTTAIVGGYNDNNDTGAIWMSVADSAITPAGCVPSYSYSAQSICPGDTLMFAGHPYFAGGTYTDTLINAGGCDSLAILALVILDSSTAYFYLQPADSPHVWYIILPSSGSDVTYTWNWGDSTSSTGDTVSHTYAAPGYYNICLTVADSAGCFATYCDTNVYLFKDQSSQMVYVHVVQYPTGISEVKSSSPIHLYPNPNRGSFTLQTSASIGSTYIISDMLGHIITQRSIHSDTEAIDLPAAADGVYTLTVAGCPPVRFVVLR